VEEIPPGLSRTEETLEGPGDQSVEIVCPLFRFGPQQPIARRKLISSVRA
jgi:hypothetical protein